VLISYAQNFEDIMLWRALKGVGRGFYIDIGAQDPIVDSVSQLFYEHGWRGVHVEPVKHYADKLRAARSDEVVLQLAICAHMGKEKFFEIPGTGLSTAVGENARECELAGHALRETEVQCLTLAALLDNCRHKEVHWLKMDIEGMEGAAIGSWPPSKVRPWIVVIESVNPITLQSSHSSWEKQLDALGYIFSHFDGLNRFYVSGEHLDLLPAFKCGPNIFDSFAFNGTATAPFCLKLQNQTHQSNAVMDLGREAHRSAVACAEDVRRILDLLNAEFANLKVRATELGSELAIRAREAAVSKKHAEDVTAKLQAARVLLKAAQAERLASEYRCNIGRARAAALELEIVRLQCSGHDPTREANDRLHERDAARAELDAIRASRSWRLTRPLRLMAAVLSGLRARRMGGTHFDYRGLVRRWVAGFLELLLRAYRFSPAFKSGAKLVLRQSPALAAKLAAFASNRNRAIANDPRKTLGHGASCEGPLHDVNQPIAKVLEQLKAHRSFAQRGQ